MNIEINREDIKKLMESAKKEHEELGKIIYPILNNFELEKKEILEVCQIGKFVHKVDTDIRITDKPKPPNPDFIIEYKSELIGLEHTQILTDDASRYFKIKTLFDYAEKEFEKKYPNTNVHATISILNDELNYKQSEKSALAEKIADMVQWTRLEMEFELPEFITRIKTGKHSQVSFTYKEKNWRAEYLTKERLLQEVQKKETKISEYKTSKTDLSEYWLVLLIGSLSSVSYELNENVDYSIKSDFERVYLMADFDAKVIRVA
ncbi:hypothetical protein ACW5R3_12345 [Bizionia sp. KMM 8389]